ncbi:MAG: hypothetical protein IID40_04695 [Planctomycetes bacterium]|nr:hypothetical protein [Planctomycetota bacterium]
MTTAFADYLTQRGNIPPGTAQEMSAWVAQSRTPIGLIAMGHGLLAGPQIDEVLERQRKSRTRFGEIAVEMGLLSKTQVDTLLEIQRFRQSADLAEGLALTGALSFEQASEALADFLRSEATNELIPCGGTEGG